MKQIFISLTAGTDVGRVRTNNEDNFILNKELSENDWFLPAKNSKPIRLCEQGCLLSVADGMGGLNAGEVASEIAISTVRDEFSKEDLKKISKSDRSIEKFLKKCVLLADENIKRRVAADSSTAGMGTTLVILWVCGLKAHIVWCGDSRGYVFNQNSGLRRITKDHSYVQQLVDEGKLRPDLAFDHPDSNIITRCLGDFPSKSKPDYCSIGLQAGDILMICSDGLCGLCRDDEIQQVLRENSEDVEACRVELINHAMAAGGYDNCTVAICKIESVGAGLSATGNTAKKLSSTVNEFVTADERPVKAEVPEEKTGESEELSTEVSEVKEPAVADAEESEVAETVDVPEAENATGDAAAPESGDAATLATEDTAAPESGDGEDNDSETASDEDEKSGKDKEGNANDNRLEKVIVVILLVAVAALCVLKYFK